MERLRPGLRVKFVSNWTLKMKPVNHRRFSLRRSCYGFGSMAEKGPLLLATMGNVPQCIETSSIVARALQTLMFCQCLYMMFACLHVLCNLGDVLVLFYTGRPYCWESAHGDGILNSCSKLLRCFQATDSKHIQETSSECGQWGKPGRSTYASGVFLHCCQKWNICSQVPNPEEFQKDY